MNRTQEIANTARAYNPGVDRVDDGMLEAVRRQTMRNLDVEDFPRTKIYQIVKWVGRGLRWTARHKVASEMGVLVPQA